MAATIPHGDRDWELPADGPRSTPYVVPRLTALPSATNAGPQAPARGEITRYGRRLGLIRPRTGTPRAPIVAPSGRRHPAADRLIARARSLWPGLPPRELAGTRGDPHRIVRLVSRRSNEAPDVLFAMLTRDAQAEV